MLLFACMSGGRQRRSGVIADGWGGHVLCRRSRETDFRRLPGGKQGIIP